MASRPARPEDFEDTSVSMDHLLTEYEGWSGVLDRDDYDLIVKTKALYRFAMNNYNEPGRDLLLQAIRAFEAAKSDD
ncbi:hypothetical protein [Mycobacteroides abscessus]